MLYIPIWESRRKDQHTKGLRSLAERKLLAAYSSTNPNLFDHRATGLHLPHLLPVNPTENAWGIENRCMFLKHN